MFSRTQSTLCCVGSLLMLASGACTPPALSDGGIDASVVDTIELDSSVGVLDSARPDVRVAPPGLSFSWRENGTMELGADGVPFDGLEFVVRTSTGERAFSSLRAVSSDGGVSRVRRGEDGLEVELVWQELETNAAAALRWIVRGSNTTVRGVTLRSSAQWLPDDTRFVTDGSQSWSFAGAVTIPPNTMLMRGADGFTRYPSLVGNVLEDRLGMSFLRGEIAYGMGGLAVCAAPPFDRWTAITVERPGSAYQFRVEQGLYNDEAVALNAGTELSGSWVFSRANAQRPFACATHTTQARRHTGTAFPRGWWSWNTLFARIDATKIEAQNAPLQQLDPGATHVTVDDGWERAWGDWRESAAFGTTIEALATRLRTRRQTLGLWLAPFLVDPAAPLFQEHPEWFVRDSSDRPLLTEFVPGRRFAVLDATRAEVRTHLTNLFRDLRARGVALFKIDFLFGGALEGRRAMPGSTGLQAYRMGLEAIAEGAGDTHLNGCGAFVGPTLPWVDSLRVGADNTFDRVQPFWGSVAALARNLAVRTPTLPPEVLPDPDQPVARTFEPEQARAFLAAGLLGGRTFGYGDDLSTLDAPLLALYREPWFVRLRDGLARPLRAQEPTSGEAIGEEFLESPTYDSIGAFRTNPRSRSPWLWVGELSDGKRVTLVFNRSAARTLRVPAALFSGARVRELVGGMELSVAGSAFELAMPARSVRVLEGTAP